MKHSASHPSVDIVASISLSLVDGSICFQSRRYILAPPPPSAHHFLGLQLVASVLHPFLSDVDAARLLRVSRTTALALLPGFIFQEHVFVGESEAQMRRMKALYHKYDLRPTRMCLSAQMKSFSLDTDGGRSLFPSSLTSLLLGPPPRVQSSLLMEGGLFNAETTAWCEAVQCPWSERSCDESSDEANDEWYWSLLFEDGSGPVQSLIVSEGPLNCPLLPGVLPHGLRRLQFPEAFACRLTRGSIPSTVEILQLSRWDQPLMLGGETLLPSSLVHLVLGSYNQRLSTHTLPPRLERLSLNMWTQELDVGVLPSSLKALQLEAFNRPLRPGALPAGLTHLVLRAFRQPLSVGSLPPSHMSLHQG
jgi:hypothetical protein